MIYRDLFKKFIWAIRSTSLGTLGTVVFSDGVMGFGEGSRLEYGH